MLLFISAILLVSTTVLIVRRCPDERGIRFWAALAAVNLHMTLAHLIASAFHELNPAGVLVTQACMTAVVTVAMPRAAARLKLLAKAWPRPVPAIVRWPGWREPCAVVMLLVATSVIAISLVEQMQRPITGFDERMYNCSRVLHWIQHGHIWPWVTNNDAQVDFPIGSEVFFSWPLIFLKVEWVARLTYWLGYPCAAVGVYLLGRLLGIGRAAGLAAAAVFAATPTILSASGINQKQDIWTAAMLVGTVYWMVRCWRDGGRLNAAMGGAYLVLAINVKITAIVVGPLVLLAVMVPGGGILGLRRRLVAMTAGGAVALAASGLGVTIGHNLAEYRHPFGPESAAKVLSPDWSDREVYTHAVRVPLYLLELPAQPIESLRKWWLGMGSEVLYRLDAHRALPGERRRAWPGAFEFEAGALAYRYSLGGIVWMVALMWGLLAVGKRLVLLTRKRPGGPLPAAALVLLASAMQFGALVFLIRWVGGGPDRYWVAPYALGLPAAAVCIDGWIRKRRWIAVPALAAVLVTVYPSVKTTWLRLESLQSRPLTSAATDEPYTEVLTKLPRGARILLFANRNTRDYPLFLPRHGYINQVFPWGRVKFDEARLARMVEAHAITHAVFEYEDRVGFHWYPGIKVDGMVEWFRARPDFREVPLDTPRQRVFERIGR